MTISVGSAPTATIAAPTDGATFRAGDVITYSGDATDPEDGTLPASAFTWNIDFLHDGHVHPGTAVTGVKTGTFTIPTSGHDFEGNTRYRITLTVTDSNGLTDTKSVIVWPQKVNLSFDTGPSGLTLYVDGVARTTPFVLDTLIGFNHTIEARDQTLGRQQLLFSSWSDGGAQTHTITVPSAAQSYRRAMHVAAPPRPGCCGMGLQRDQRHDQRPTRRATATPRRCSTDRHWSPAKIRQRPELRRVNDYLSVPNSPQLDISGSALTMSMWINPARHQRRLRWCSARSGTPA